MIYLLGDFNIRLLHKASSLCTKYISFMRLFNFNQLISEATRVTSSSSTLIDNILSNTSEKICQFGTVNLGLSDHCLIYATMKVVKGQINKHNTSPVKRICVFEHSVMTNFNCACPAIQRGQGSGFLSEGSSWLAACMSKQRRFWRDCANAQARLNLRCSHRR